MFNGIDGAAMEHKVGELGFVRGIFVVDLVAAARGGPSGAIPYGGIEGHGLRGEVPAHGLGPHHLPDGDVVNVKSAQRTERTG